MKLPLFGFVRHFLPAEAAAPMRIAPAPSTLQELQARATLVIDRPGGTHVDCVRGCVWITHDGDPKDLVLPAGTSYTSTRGACMRVYAFEPTSILVC
jgi:hypothetical protein